MKNRLTTMFGFGILLLASGKAFSDPKEPLLRANLKGFQEVPAVSTATTGQFLATIINGATIAYELTYSGLEGTVTQAHIHLGQKSVTGGISLRLCQTATNLDSTKLAPTCPQEAKGDTTVKGMLTAANLLGPSGKVSRVGRPVEHRKSLPKSLRRSVLASLMPMSTHRRSAAGKSAAK